MVSNHLVFFLAFATAVGVPAFAAKPSPALVEVKPDGSRTVFITTSINRGDRVIAQYSDTQGALRCCVRLAKQKLLSRADVSDELRGNRVSAYALAPLTGKDVMPFIGAALVFRGLVGAMERATLAGNADKSLPKVCLSSEGAHLRQSADGKAKAHLYMHFDYAVDPTCDQR